MFDLHVHTNASDGELGPKKIIEEATKNGVNKIAITDHDTLLNVEPCIKEGKKNNVLVIPGIEISAEIDKGQLHILGYGMDIHNSELCQVMKILKKSREQRNDKIIDILKEKYGIDIRIEDVKKFSVGESLGRPHFAKALIEKGLATSVKDAFDKYLAADCINNIKRYVLKPKAAIQLINNSGGIAVIAHPHSLKLSDEETLLKIQELKSYGLAGVEAYHSDHSSKQAEAYKKMAELENLIITCGSDFHGKSIKPNIELGKGKDSNLPTNNDRIFQNFYRKLEYKKNLESSGR